MKNKAIVLIILAGVFWGTSGIFVHFLAPAGLNALALTTIRGTVSALVMGGYVFLKDRQLFKMNYKALILSAISGVSVFFTAFGYYASMQLTSVSTAVVLMYTSPVLVMVFSVIFFKEQLTFSKMLSVVSMLCGCVLVAGLIGGAKFHLVGILYGFMSSLAYSVYNITAKYQMKNKVNPLSACMYGYVFMMLTAFVFSEPVMILRIASESVSLSVMMIMCGICTCVVPYFLYTISLKTLPVGTASALSIVEPMSATLFSVVFLSEKLSPVSAGGIALILVSVYMLSREKNL